MTYAALCEMYLQHLAHAKQASKHTVDSYRRDLKSLGSFLPAAKSEHVAHIGPSDLEQYLRALEVSAAAASQRRAISSIRQLFLYAQRERLIDESPARGLAAPPVVRSLPNVPSPSQTARLIDSLAADSSPKALRDRCALELLYSCGLRATELCELVVSDVDLATACVRLPKEGGEFRYVPMGEAAVQATRTYLESGRPALVQAGAHAQLLVGNHGQPMTRMVLFAMVKKRGSDAGLRLPLSPHTLRHAFALHLLHNGADLRAVQKMLGHKSIATTEVYVQGGDAGLQSTIDAHHPLSHGAAPEGPPPAPPL